MTGVHGLEHVKALAAANFAQDDAVRTHTKRVLNKIALGDLSAAFNAFGTGFQTHNVFLIELQFGRILNRHHALLLPDLEGQGIEQRCFARAVPPERRY